jgi:putative flippase GtrA
MIAVVAVVAIVGLGIAFWLLGFLFHLAGWILRVAVLAAVAALVWRRITRHRSSERV